MKLVKEVQLLSYPLDEPAKITSPDDETSEFSLALLTLYRTREFLD